MSITFFGRRSKSGPPASRWFGLSAHTRPPVIVVLSCAFLVLALVVSVLAPIIGHYDPTATDLANSFQSPGFRWSDIGSLLGTDELGRPMLMRTLVGIRQSMLLCLGAVLVSIVIGTIIGLLAGFLGGIIDQILSRLIDVQLALPFIVVALTLTTVFGPSYLSSLTAIVMTLWVPSARVIRGACLVIRGSDYVQLARVAGLNKRQILARHVFRNAVPALYVLLPLDFGRALVYESSLSFVGLGAQPPQVSLGLMVSEYRPFFLERAWLIAIPSVALGLLVLSAMIVGDWLRLASDPLRQLAR